MVKNKGESCVIYTAGWCSKRVSSKISDVRVIFCDTTEFRERAHFLFRVWLLLCYARYLFCLTPPINYLHIFCFFYCNLPSSFLVHSGVLCAWYTQNYFFLICSFESLLYCTFCSVGIQMSNELKITLSETCSRYTGCMIIFFGNLTSLFEHYTLFFSSSLLWSYFAPTLCLQKDFIIIPFYVACIVKVLVLRNWI